MNKQQVQLRELLVPLIIFLSIYSLTLCGVSAVAHDSINYLQQIDTNRPTYFPYHPLFHSHHLLYNLSAGLWLDFCRNLEIHAAADLLIAWFNALWGALALSVFYLILRKRLQAKPLTALLGTACCAFSFGFWFYSISLEVYTVPLFLLILLLYLLSSEKLTAKNFYLIGLLHGLAILYHQVNVLFGLVVLLAIITAYRQNALSLGRSLLNYFVVSLPVVIIPYWLVMFRANGFATWEDAWYWLTRYAHQPDFWQPPAFSTLLKALSGFGRCLAEGYFILGIPSVRNYVNKNCSGGFLRDEAFLMRNLDKISACLFLALTMIFFIALIFFILRHARDIRSVKEKYNRLFILTCAWLLIYSCFFFFWVPNNIEFWLCQSLCCWLLFLMLLQSSEPSKTPKILFILPLLLLTVNYGGNIRYIQDKTNDLYYSKTESLSGVLKKGDLVITGPHMGRPDQSWTTEMFATYILRYTDAEVLDLVELFRAVPVQSHKANFQRLLSTVDKTLTKGGRVFIYAEVVEMGQDTAGYLKTTPFLFKQLPLRYQDKWRKINVGGELLYLLEPEKELTIAVG